MTQVRERLLRMPAGDSPGQTRQSAWAEMRWGRGRAGGAAMGGLALPLTTQACHLRLAMGGHGANNGLRLAASIQDRSI